MKETQAQINQARIKLLEELVNDAHTRIHERNTQKLELDLANRNDYDKISAWELEHYSLKFSR